VSELTVRNLTEDLVAEIQQTFGSAFLRDPADMDADWFRSGFEPERFIGTFDGDEMIGTAAILTRKMSLPGTGQVPVAAVTTVSVKPWHRRRGALSKMMRSQLHGMHEQGDEAFAALWASEGAIYGRFGYAVAAHYTRASISKGTPYRPGVDLGKDRVRELPRDEAMPLMHELYERIAPQRVGWLSRSDGAWATHYWDSQASREGRSSFRFALHPDGYVSFRTAEKWGDRGPEATLALHELVAATPQASAALWRYLLDFDHVSEIDAQVSPSEPVFLMLQDPRQAVRKTFDSLWIRLVDVDRALVQRGYSAPVDTVFEITDVFCPWNQGRWRLVADASGAATVRRTTQDPDLVLDVTDLGAVFLGGVRLTDLAAAGRVTELTPGSLVRTSRAFIGDQAPHCLEVF
jgi:predicted acetyltransferase